MLAEIHRLVARKLGPSELSAEDLARRIESNRAAEGLYVFRPEVAGVILYVKLARQLTGMIALLLVRHSM